MKRKILLLPILSIIIAFSGCFSNEDKIPLNNEINEKINDYVAEHSQLVLDEIVNSWEYVLIDTAYHTLSSLEKLGISNSDMIQDIPYEDGVIVLAFICDDKVVTYTLINSSDEQASSLLDEYVYQLSGKTYPKGQFLSRKHNKKGH